MFKKIITLGVVAISIIAGFVLANPSHGGGHGGLSLPIPPIPTIHINTGGLMALLRNPPIPIIKLPPLNLPMPSLPGVPIPMISLPTSGHGHHGLSMPQLPIGDLLNAIIGNHDSWDSWA